MATTDSKSVPFRLTLSFSAPASCPACGWPLMPMVATVIDGMVFCQGCAASQPRAVALALWLAARTDAGRHLMVCSGVTAYRRPTAASRLCQPFTLLEVLKLSGIVTVSLEPADVRAWEPGHAVDDYEPIDPQPRVRTGRGWQPRPPR